MIPFRYVGIALVLAVVLALEHFEDADDDLEIVGAARRFDNSTTVVDLIQLAGLVVALLLAVIR